MGEGSHRTLVSKPLRVVMIGSGNVASALAPALDASGAAEVTAVYSPTAAHAERLARHLVKAKAVSTPQEVPTDADLYMVAVTDSAVERVAEDFRGFSGAGIWAHTSGSVAMDALACVTHRYGVFYPLQTFSVGVPVDFGCVPMFIEAADTDTLLMLKRLADFITPKVYEADSTLRGKMHAAAVFACNFVNHLWAVADNILLRECGLDIKVLAPLIRETMRKALTVRPAEAQTGPAVRGDNEVMAKHLALLTKSEGQLYKMLSQSIIDYYKIPKQS